MSTGSCPSSKLTEGHLEAASAANRDTPLVAAGTPLKVFVRQTDYE